MSKIRFLTHFTIMFLLLPVLVAGRFLPAFAEDELYIRAYVDYEKAYEVIDAVNNERNKRGIASLDADSVLMEAALTRAAETVIYFEHARPNGSTWNSVSSKVNGENLAMGSGDALHIMDLWMDSPDHKDNILYSPFRSMGVACICYEGTYYWVQLFSKQGGSDAGMPGSGELSVGIDLPGGESTPIPMDYEITYVSEGAEPLFGIGSSVNLGLRGGGADFDPSRIIWESSDEGVARVSEEGVMNIISAGEALISASSGDTRRAEITVRAAYLLGETYIMETFGRRYEIKKRTITEGAAAEPTFTIFGRRGILKEGEDYKVIYEDNKAPGTGRAVIIGTGEYAGSLVRTFTIEQGI